MEGGIKNRAISAVKRGVRNVVAVSKGEKGVSFLPGRNGTSRNPLSAATYRAGHQVGRVIRPASSTGQTVQNLPLWAVFADCIVNFDVNLLATLQCSPRKNHDGLKKQNDSSTLLWIEVCGRGQIPCISNCFQCILKWYQVEGCDGFLIICIDFKYCM